MKSLKTKEKQTPRKKSRSPAKKKIVKSKFKIESTIDSDDK